MRSDYVKSLTRTFVPVVVAAIVTGLAHAGIPLPASSRTLLASVIGGAVGASWYGLVRLLERRYPKLGWLLGSPGAPSYPAAVTAAKTVVADAVTAEVKKAAKPVKTSMPKGAVFGRGPVPTTPPPPKPARKT